MTRRDMYYNKAKQEGYRARSAYKLKQLDREADLMAPGDTVVDLGAAPGGWLQVAAEAVGEEGTVIGVDRQRIDSLDHEQVETIRGDVTDERTIEELRDRLGVDADSEPDGDDVTGGPVDLVLSDMAPNMTGEYELDHARSIHLARQAAEFALSVLASGGDLAVKVFDGPDLEAFRADLQEEFRYVRTITPEASRDASSERYLVAKERLTAPVRVGDRLEVTIDDVGSEGDGIARVDGFTLFVSDAAEGDEIEIEVTDVKPRFGFAEPVS